MVRRGERCSYCGKSIHKGANYCHYCGKNRHAGHAQHHRCPSCKRLIEHGTKYCNHCGFDLTKKKPHQPRHFLFHISLFLFVLSGIFLLYSYPTSIPSEQIPVEDHSPEASLLISDMSCSSEGAGFRLCGTISWEGGSYAKAYIPGGRTLENAEQHFQPFVFCDSLDSEDGLRFLRSFLYDQQGRIVAEASQSQLCEKKQESPLPPKYYTFSRTLQFLTHKTIGKYEGFGTVSTTFPDPLLSCSLTGNFSTLDGRNKPEARPPRATQYCDGASGAFSGMLTALRQAVTVDPAPFIWDSQIFADPEPTTHSNYMLYAYTCDTQYYTKRRYFTNAVARGIGTRTLTLDWYYKNDDTQPYVLFTVDLVCQLQEST